MVIICLPTSDIVRDVCSKRGKKRFLETTADEVDFSDSVEDDDEKDEEAKTG